MRTKGQAFFGFLKLLLVIRPVFGGGYETQFDPSSCSLSGSAKAEIRAHNSTVRHIVAVIRNGFYKGEAYRELSNFADLFGNRMTGSEALENAIDWLRDEMQKIPGFRNVHTENVTVPKWLRGPEWARLVEPWEKTIVTMAFQYSVSTDPPVITAEVVVYYNKAQLKESPGQFSGKIVACVKECNVSELAVLGAKAALTSAPFGLYTPHRGGRVYYKAEYPKIPVAEVTMEDMRLFIEVSRLGKKMVMKLSMHEPSGTVNVTSRNLIGDYLGSVMPESFVGVTAHMDSWDVGQGAQDDGFGVIFGILMVRLFTDLRIETSRTVRAMFWTSEELGLIGSKAYVKAHPDQMKAFQAVFEADVGCELNGLLYHGNQEMGCLVNEILDMIRPLIPHVTFQYRESWSSDLDNFVPFNVPTLGLQGGPRYRWYTHSEPDTMTAIVSSQLDRCFALYAATAYVVANMKIPLPRGQGTDSKTTYKS